MDFVVLVGRFVEAASGRVMALDWRYGVEVFEKLLRVCAGTKDDDAMDPPPA